MGTSSKLKFDHASTKRRVVLALPPCQLLEELRSRLTSDGHQLVTTEEAGAFDFALAVIAEGIGATAGVIVVGSSFADGEWMPMLLRCRSSLRGTLVVVLDEGRDEDELDAIADAGWVTIQPPLRVEHVAYAVAHADIWRFLRPSRALFERIGG